MTNVGRGPEARATFANMVDSTKHDWMVIAGYSEQYQRELPDRVITHLKILDGDFGGFPVHRLEHSLQTASRAYRDGMDEEYVVCALLHDIGDTLGSANHADVAAAILKPYVSERNHWLVQKHAVFQGLYYFHQVDLDRDMRERYRGHPAFEYTAQFCHLYDQSSFDPAYPTMPLAAFEPMVHRLLTQPKRSIYLKHAIPAEAP